MSAASPDALKRQPPPARATAVDLYVQCNPFVDVVGTVDAAVLVRLGMPVGSAGVADANDVAVAELFKTLAAAEATAQVGGAGLATARYANWILRGPRADRAGSTVLDRPPVVGYFGGVGDDADGALIRDTLSREGVVPLLATAGMAERTQGPPAPEAGALSPPPPPPTGRCAVAVVGSERTVRACAGAWSLLESDPGTSSFDRLSGAADARRHASVVYAPAFSLVANADHAVAVAAEASARGKLVVTNVGAPFLLSDPAFAAGTMALLRIADVVVGNAEEADAVAAVLELPRLDPGANAEATRTWLSATAFRVSGALFEQQQAACEEGQAGAGPGAVGKCVVFTDGAKGAVAGLVTPPSAPGGRRHGSMHAKDDGDDEPDATVVAEPVPPLAGSGGSGGVVVDTAGAGDAFIGGLCAGVFEMLRQRHGAASPAAAPTSSSTAVRERFFAGATCGYAANARTLLRIGHLSAGHIVRQRGCAVPPSGGPCCEVLRDVVFE